MKTIRQAFEFCKSTIASGQGQSEVLARHLLEDLFFTSDLTISKTLNREEWDRVIEAIDRLNRGEPLQYVTGVAHFYGYRFMVNSSVLIPRPETEELVFSISRDLKQSKNQQIRLLDIGTGSGCIALTLKKLFSHLEVVAVDISGDALAVASENMKNMGLHISLIRDDILHPETGEILKEKWHYIVSNPPYIQPEEKDLLEKHVVEYEPMNALIPNGLSPLEMYRSILQFADLHLYPGGKIYLELNEFLADEIRDVAIQQGFDQVKLLKDMQGKYRILLGQKPD
ncbi:MAG: peptide chain release factor N(5)-glutamine methyltransferase [Saprospiraceae bacterium]|nr:peptide chain release factor N(5)-glutamine methyltransferase [Saprospiraceae bacterium]